jgi:hypothetical protein
MVEFKKIFQLYCRILIRVLAKDALKYKNICKKCFSLLQVLFGKVLSGQKMWRKYNFFVQASSFSTKEITNGYMALWRTTKVAKWHYSIRTLSATNYSSSEQVERFVCIKSYSLFL